MTDEQTQALLDILYPPDGSEPDPMARYQWICWNVKGTDGVLS